MKYQQGCFLWVNKGIIVNGILLLPIGIGQIRKYKIPKDLNKIPNKLSIYEYIKMNYWHYDIEHLLNPYLYFEDAPL